MSSDWYARPVLVGEHVRMEPLTVEHAAGLLTAGADPGIWTWLSERQPTDLAAAQDLITRALANTSRAALRARLR